MKQHGNTLRINPKVLLSIYSAMPLSLVFIAIDKALLSGSIGKSLPSDPRVFVWFILIFMVPHILASFFSFAEREYFDFYKSKLLRGAQIAVVLGLFIPALLSATVIPIIIFATYTMIHVFMQQSGISKSLMRNVTSSHRYWQYLGISIATMLYIYLLVPAAGFRDTIDNSFLAMTLVTVVIIVYTILALQVVKQSKTQLGKIYFIGSHIIPILGVFYVATGYPILALIVPRFIHDLTAYTYYITHDNNRFKQEQSNVIYKSTSRLRLPIFFANPLISIALAYAVVQLNSTAVLSVLTCVFFLHYYTESFIWKNDTLHRMQIGYTSYK
jgi:hypothetical protein